MESTKHTAAEVGWGERAVAQNQIAVQDCWLGKQETSLKPLQSTFKLPNLSNTIRPRTGIFLAGHNAGRLNSSKRSGARLGDVHVFLLACFFACFQAQHTFH